MFLKVGSVQHDSICFLLSIFPDLFTVNPTHMLVQHQGGMWRRGSVAVTVGMVMSINEGRDWGMYCWGEMLRSVFGGGGVVNCFFVFTSFSPVISFYILFFSLRYAESFWGYYFTFTPIFLSIINCCEGSLFRTSIYITIPTIWELKKHGQLTHSSAYH